MENEVKIVTLGEGRVGKTSLTLKFVRDVFNENETSTINANYLQKSLTIDSEPVQLNIWDTAGQERFRAIAPIYYQSAKGAVIVYDITDKATFDRVVAWVTELKKFADPEIVIVIAGNKCDKESQRQIQQAMAVEYAKSVDAQHFNTSAKTGRGVEEMYTALAKAITAKRSSRQVRSGRMAKKIKLEADTVEEPNKPKKKCC